MRWMFHLVGLMVLLACSNGTNDGPGQPTPPSAEAPPSPSPPTFAVAGLPEGNHAGLIIGFEPVEGARAQRTDEALAEAAQAGSTLSRVQIDWPELEPQPGVFDPAALDEALAKAEAIGPLRFVTVSTLDTGILTLPADLMVDGSLAPGLRLSDPAVADRFEALLDWLVPRLVAADVWGLSIANEGETLVEDGVITSQEAEVFLQRGLRQIAGDAPELARGVTLTFGANDRFPSYAEAVQSESTLAIYNYYCLDAALVTTRQPVWTAGVESMKSGAGDLPIMLQELGCPVGYEDQPSDIQSSPEVQADFLAYFEQVIATDRQFRASYAFQLLDWSAELAASCAAPIGQDGFELAADRLEEWLATSGLCSWTEDRCRPGWQAWLSLTEAARRTQQ